RELPARGEQVGDLEADVVASPLVLAAGVPEPDDQPVDPAAAALVALPAAAPEATQESPPPSAAASLSAGASPAAAPPPASAAPAALLRAGRRLGGLEVDRDG